MVSKATNNGPRRDPIVIATSSRASRLVIASPPAITFHMEDVRLEPVERVEDDE